MELGAGTGLFTAPMLDALSSGNQSFTYVANEPNPKMHESLSPMLSPAVQLNTVPIGGAEKLTGTDFEFDLVIAAQSFHWFTPYPASFMECRRLLKRGGALVLTWNERDTTIPWIKDLEDEIITPLYPADNNAAPRQQSGKWEESFEHFLGNYYGNLHKETFRGDDSVVQRGHEQVMERVMSLSVVAGLEDEGEKKKIAARTREFLETHRDTKGREEDLELRYFTDVYYTRTIG